MAKDPTVTNPTVTNKLDLKADVTPDIIPEAENKDEMVTVPKSMLDNILAQIGDLKTSQKQYEQTASQDQVRKIEALRASGKLVKSVKISIIDGKLVKAWKSVADEVYIDHALGKEVSRQSTMISFYDGSEQEMSQIDFSRRKTYQEFEVITEGKNRDGEIILTVVDETGRETEINSRYIN